VVRGIYTPEIAPVSVMDHLGPYLLGISHHHTVGELESLFGQEGGVESPHDHWNASGPIHGRDLVGPAGGIGFHGHSHQVGGGIQVETLHLLILERAVVPGRGQAVKDGERKRFHGSSRGAT
jgi:hypothetical protein